jgi:hypothetical protein
LMPHSGGFKLVAYRLVVRRKRPLMRTASNHNVRT